MNKTRLENLSDGVFAIVFTILVLEIRLPEELIHPTTQELARALLELWPVFLGYFVSFIVLTTFWVGHSFFFSDMMKIINRQLIGLNMLYLAFVSLVPFSAYVLGKYTDVQTAVLLYGINIFVIGALTVARLEYALWSKEIDTTHNKFRHITQARIRTYLTPAFSVLGIFVSYVSLHAALFLYAFPIVFNIVPGLLNAIETRLGMDFGEE